MTREALESFTQRLVEHFAPQKVILFGSQARGVARWDSDADILVVMKFEGSSFEQRLAMLEVGAPSFPVDLLLCKPEAAAQRYGWGDPFIREAIITGKCSMAELTPLVEAWIRYAEDDWHDAKSWLAQEGTCAAFAFTCSNASRSYSRRS